MALLALAAWPILGLTTAADATGAAACTITGTIMVRAPAGISPSRAR